MVVLEARVIGFWNPVDKRYHWYVTNLLVGTAVIYPLYRLRWQLELVFKACKSSLCLADMPSANENIIRSLILVALVGNLIAFAVGKYALIRFPQEQQRAFSFQRAAMLLLHIGAPFLRFLIRDSKKALSDLMAKIKTLAGELFDPNFRNRETSLQQVWSQAGL